MLKTTSPPESPTFRSKDFLVMSGYLNNRVAPDLPLDHDFLDRKITLVDTVSDIEKTFKTFYSPLYDVVGEYALAEGFPESGERYWGHIYAACKDGMYANMTISVRASKTPVMPSFYAFFGLRERANFPRITINSLAEHILGLRYLSAEANPETVAPEFRSIHDLVLYREGKPVKVGQSAAEELHLNLPLGEPLLSDVLTK